MSTRISREMMFMDIASIVAKRSTCFRLNVGAVITENHRIVSIGYNGRKSGAPHCQGNNCPGRFACQETIHAEANAIGFLLPDNHNVHDLEMYVTDSPCRSCAAKIMNSHLFKRVYYRTPYRLTEGLDDLAETDIEVFQVLPSGVIMDYRTKEFLNA